MKSTAVLTTIFATAAVVFADSCNRGGVYCGISLLNKGKLEHNPSFPRSPNQ